MFRMQKEYILFQIQKQKYYLYLIYSLYGLEIVVIHCAIIPSFLPIKPKFSAVVAFKDTHLSETESNLAIFFFILSLYGDIFGSSHIIFMSECNNLHLCFFNNDIACFKKISEFAFFHLGSLSENIFPMSPSEIVPSIESTKA